MDAAWGNYTAVGGHGFRHFAVAMEKAAKPMSGTNAIKAWRLQEQLGLLRISRLRSGLTYR